MITYARGLQYWAEKHNLPESPDSCPLVGGVVELREAVREYITFTNWDILQGLGAVYLGATNQQPQTTLLAEYCHHQSMNPVHLILALWKLPPKPLPWLLLMWTWLDVTLHHLEQKGKTIICWLLLPL